MNVLARINNMDNGQYYKVLIRTWDTFAAQYPHKIKTSAEHTRENSSTTKSKMERIELLLFSGNLEIAILWYFIAKLKVCLEFQGKR